jgi:hypothetical protein
VALAAEEPCVATFCCDITPPLGQPLAACDAIRTVEQPLLAKGIVLKAGGQRYVLCALDWCVLCNGAYDALQSKIAAAAGTDAAYVAVQCLHQHSAPVVDTDAQQLLAEFDAASGIHITQNVFQDIERRLAAAVKESLGRFEPFDQIGTGQAKVDRVGSSRRPRDQAGKICTRFSVCKDAAVRALPEGLIDPYVKTITLAQAGKPLVRLHYYASHPQTKYGDGRASSDMVGDAREALERKEGGFRSISPAVAAISRWASTTTALGNLCIVHLPGEPMVNFQFFAQGLRSGAFVAVAGYGDAGPSYICTEQAAGERGYEPTDSNVKPEAAATLKKAITTLLGFD